MIGFWEGMEAEWPGDTSRLAYSDWLQDHDLPTIAAFVRKGAWRQKLGWYDIDWVMDRAHREGHQWVACVRDRRKVSGERCWKVHLHQFAPVEKESSRVWAWHTNFSPDKWFGAFEVLKQLRHEGVRLTEETTAWVTSVEAVLPGRSVRRKPITRKSYAKDHRKP